MNYNTERDRYLVPSLMRSDEALKHLAANRQGLTLAELDPMCSAPKSSLYRILITLHKLKLVSFDDKTKKYRMGVKLWELGAEYLDQQEIADNAHLHLQKLARESGESVFLSRLEQGEVVYLRMIEMPKSATDVRKLDRRVPAHCTATGEAIMAFLPGDEVDDIIRYHGLRSFNSNTVTDPAELKERLSKIRKNGYAIVDGEYNANLLCVSSPVLDSSERPVASVTVVVLSREMADGRRVDEIGEMVRSTATNISQELGYTSEP